MKVLFIQPYDRPTLSDERKKMYMSRAMFEVGNLIPAQYEIKFLDINLEAKKNPRLSIQEIIQGAMEKVKPELILLAFPTYPQGSQVYEIIIEVKKYKPQAKIILGGAVLNLIKDAPQKLWNWTVDACYWGNGSRLTELVEAVLASDESFVFEPDLRGGLIDDYDSKEFYTIHGRFNFEGYLENLRNCGLEPMGLVEMVRGCKNKCIFCAINADQLGCFMRKHETVLSEIHYLAEKGVAHIHIIDPTFGIMEEETNFLLEELALFHVKNSKVKFEVITRPEYLTEVFVEKLKKAGIVGVGLGMEIMSQAVLDSLLKNSKPALVKRAVLNLAESGIRTKLFHIASPESISVETINFLLELTASRIKFIVQSSFLRPLPTPQLYEEAWTQDRTVFNPKQDTLERLMEYLLVNLAFPSMDLDFEDSEIREMIKKALESGQDLKTLFSQSKEGGKIILKIGKYVFTESATHKPMNLCITKKQK